MNELRPATRALIDRAMRIDGAPAHSRRRIERALMASAFTTALTGGAAAANAAVKVGATPSLWMLLSTGKLGFVVATSIGLVSGSIALAVVAPLRQTSASVGARAPLSSPQQPARPKSVAPAPTAATAEPIQPLGAPTIQSAVAPKPSVADETRLLGQVQEALRNGSGQHALGLLERYRRQFGRGVLAEEASAAEVFARCAAGDRQGAHRSAQDFIRSFPGSPILPRVYASCGMSEPGE